MDLREPGAITRHGNHRPTLLWISLTHQKLGFLNGEYIVRWTDIIALFCDQAAPTGTLWETMYTFFQKSGFQVKSARIIY